MSLWLRRLWKQSNKLLYLVYVLSVELELAVRVDAGEGHFENIYIWMLSPACASIVINNKLEKLV